jgi:hypothetical protein
VGKAFVLPQRSIHPCFLEHKHSVKQIDIRNSAVSEHVWVIKDHFLPSIFKGLRNKYVFIAYNYRKGSQLCADTYYNFGNFLRRDRDTNLNLTITRLRRRVPFIRFDTASLLVRENCQIREVINPFTPMNRYALRL